MLTACLLLLFLCEFANPLPRFGNKFYTSNAKYGQNNGGYTWNEEWFEYMPIDHFSFADDRTFDLRYFINLDSYTPGGPIFFYTGVFICHFYF